MSSSKLKSFLIEVIPGIMNPSPVARVIAQRFKVEDGAVVFYAPNQEPIAFGPGTWKIARQEEPDDGFLLDGRIADYRGVATETPPPPPADAES